ncbi:MAG: hypothetical protein ACYTE3_20420 [Planctomycetota bacterium]|jgi:hypothetical protein
MNKLIPLVLVLCFAAGIGADLKQDDYVQYAVATGKVTAEKCWRLAPEENRRPFQLTIDY